MLASLRALAAALLVAVIGIASPASAGCDLDLPRHDPLGPDGFRVLLGGYRQIDTTSGTALRFGDFGARLGERPRAGPGWAFGLRLTGGQTGNPSSIHLGLGLDIEGSATLRAVKYTPVLPDPVTEYSPFFLRIGGSLSADKVSEGDEFFKIEESTIHDITFRPFALVGFESAGDEPVMRVELGPYFDLPLIREAQREVHSPVAPPVKFRTEYRAERAHGLVGTLRLRLGRSWVFTFEGRAMNEYMLRVGAEYRF